VYVNNVWYHTLFFRFHLTVFPNLVPKSWTQEILLPSCRDGTSGTCHICRHNVYISGNFMFWRAITDKNNLEKEMFLLVYISLSRGGFIVSFLNSLPLYIVQVHLNHLSLIPIFNPLQKVKGWKFYFAWCFQSTIFCFPTLGLVTKNLRVKSSLVSEIKQVTQMNKHVPNAPCTQCQCQTQRQSEEWNDPISIYLLGESRWKSPIKQCKGQRKAKKSLQGVENLHKAVD
jgi:hypothetical protein